MKLAKRLGLKFLELGEALTGGRGWRSTSSSDSAGPVTGSEMLAALASIPTVYACVNRKALDMGRVPLVIGRVGKGGEFTPLPYSKGDKPSQNPAALFASVNPNEGPAAFFARTHAMKNLTGEAFWQLEKGLARNGRPEEIWLVPSDRVTIKKGEDRKAKGYEYRTPGGQLVKLEPEQVMHTKLPNPGDDWRGLSPLSSARVYAWLEEWIGIHHVQMFRQGGMPPGWLKFKEYVPAEDREEVREELRKRTAGTRNAHRMGVLWGDADWIPGAISSKDGDFPALSDLAREQVCAALGVPPLYVMNLEHASYANALQQKELYWLSTLAPELELLAQDITELLLWRIYGDDRLEARFDLEKVAAVQDIRLARAETLQRLVAGGLLTQNEARLELGKPKVTNGDALYFPQALVPSGVVSQPQPARAVPAFGRKAWIDDPTRHAKRQDRDRDLASFVPAFERAFVMLADRQERELLAQLETAGDAKAWAAAVGRKSDPGLESPEDDVQAVLLRAYVDVVSKRGQGALDEVIDGENFKLENPAVADWLETVAGEQSKLIAKTLKEQLKATLALGEAGGATQSEIADRISELFDLRRSEALRIAWTEAGKAYNYGTLEGFRQSGVVTKKEWLSQVDDETRDAHRDADGQTVALEEFFLVDGELLEFPGAPGASAGNAINCRCTMNPFVDDGLKAAKLAGRRFAVEVRGLELDELFAEPAPAA